MFLIDGTSRRLTSRFQVKWTFCRSNRGGKLKSNLLLYKLCPAHEKFSVLNHQTLKTFPVANDKILRIRVVYKLMLIELKQHYICESE